jgi:tetratricopeptide (TPR) repeat protein
MNPDVAVGFHVVSVFFHCVCVFLLIALLRSLGLNTWVASVAAALFALTPINVASVAWAAERKNILSMMFYMLALLSYLRFRRQGGWYWYVGCILLHQSALFSKTVSVTFPMMVVLTDRLIDRRWSGESLLRAAPLAIQSMIAAGITMEVEDRARSIPIEDPQRPLVAAAAIWFYVLKAVAPVGLLPIYPLWHPSWGEIRWLLPLLGLLGAGWLLWAFRRRISPYMFWAAALYLVTTAPMLGFRNINYFQFAFVADHYFYHGGIGLFVLIALLLDALRRRLGVAAARHAITGVAAAACLTFAGLTWARCDDWQGVESFWFKTITGDRSLRFDDWAGDDSFWADKHANRNCWPAHYNLGNQAIRDAMAAVRESQTSDDPDARKAGRETYTKKMEEASVLFAEAARAHRDADPKHRELWQAYEKWIEAEYHLARMDRIVQIGQKMVDHRAQSVAGYYYLGLARKAREEHDKAEWCFQNARRVPPRRDGDIQMQSLALYHLADIYTNIAEKQNLPQALRCLEEAVRLNPRNQRAEAARRQLQAIIEKEQD